MISNLPPFIRLKYYYTRFQVNQGQNISYTYDEHGQTGYRTSMSDSSGNTKWYYDKRGRLLREDKTVLGESFTTVWSYNNADQLSYIIYPTGEKLTYTYLPQGNVDSVGEYQVGVMTDSHNRLEAAFYHANEIFAAHSLIAYEDWLTGAGRVAQLSYWDEESRQYAFFNAYEYDSVGNITKISDLNNGGQEQSFAYDSLNRLLSASTTAVGDGQYGQQSYSYDANTGNLNSRSGVGGYVYDSKPHAVVEAGSNTYQYDANGNMTRRTIDSVVWTYEYDAENHLVETKENGQTENRYLYDGVGNRVARLDANNEGTIFIGNYFEARYPAEEELISPLFDCGSEGIYCTYLPIVGNAEVNELFTGKPGISYYYADSQRIAMRTGGEAYLLFGDHLGSSSVVMNANGGVVEKAYYLPWGGERGDTSITSTDYGYTGQMREGDIYYYGARYYDPAIGRFMQADTIVPLQVQGTQAFDRYAYVNNNPLRYTDPTGHYYQECGDDNYGRCGTISPKSNHRTKTTENVTVIVARGWNIINLANQFSVFSDLMPTNLHFFDTMDNMGNKIPKSLVADLIIGTIINSPYPVYLAGYSAGGDAVLLAYIQLTDEQKKNVAGLALLEATYTAKVTNIIYQTNSDYLSAYEVDADGYSVNISSNINEVLKTNLNDKFINITPLTPLNFQGDAIQRHNYLPFDVDLAKSIVEIWGLR